MKLAGILNRRRPLSRGRVLFLLAAFFLLTTISRPGPVPDRAGTAEAGLAADAVALDGEEPGRRRVGGLLFRRGWVLRSDDVRFGGISALHVENGEVIAISDAGDLFQFALPRASGAGRVRILPLPNERASLESKSSRDAEAMLVRGERAWFGFEGANMIARYRRASWSAEAASRPAILRRWRRNSGVEAMVRLGDGRFIVFSEGLDNRAPFSPVALFSGDPVEPATRATELRYRRPDGFRVTDAALLPDGRLLILNRRFSWLSGVSAKLVVADAAGLRPGATIEWREIAELSSPLSVDNMEALSVALENGRTIVRIASDDNFMAIQRTLLLEFELGR